MGQGRGQTPANVVPRKWTAASPNETRPPIRPLNLPKRIERPDI